MRDSSSSPRSFLHDRVAELEQPAPSAWRRTTWPPYPSSPHSRWAAGWALHLVSGRLIWSGERADEVSKGKLFFYYETSQRFCIS